MEQNIDVPVTVFMAVYNSAGFLADSILSILDQTFADFEFLIVNDGSTDNSLEIINSYNDERIRVISYPDNRGLQLTRNIALSQAKGRYLAILDSDDIATPDRLQLQYDFMCSHPEVAVCGGHAYPIDTNGSVSGTKMQVPVGKDLGMQLVFKNIFLNSSVMIRIGVFRQMGGYRDYAPAEDYDLFVRMANKYLVANIDQLLLYYRIHHNNISTTNASLLKQSELRIIRNIHEQLGIPYNEQLIEINHSLLTDNCQLFSFQDYLGLLKSIRQANRESKKYPELPFESFLFNKWYEVVMHKKAGMNAFLFLFNRQIFDRAYVSPKHLRRILKLSIKNIGKLSRYTD